MKTLVNLLGTMLLVCSMQSCSFNAIKGSGQIVEKEVTISDYKAIEFSGGASLVYEQQTDAAPYFRVEIDENLFPLLIIESKNGTLRIRNKENIKPTRYTIYTNSTSLEKLAASGSIKAHLKGKLTTNQFNIAVSGSGNIVADQIECDMIQSETSGSCDLELSGTTNQFDCDISGSGKVRTKSLEANKVYCEVSGSGNFEVYAKEYLRVSISGSGEVRYIGEPQIEQSISGSGKVKRLE